MQNVLQSVQNKALHFSKMKYFDEIFIALTAVITILGWKVSAHIAMICFIFIALAATILVKNLKYIIPSTIFYVFSLGTGFSNNEIPIQLIIEATIYIIIILVFTVKQGFHFKKMKSFYGLAGFALINFLPIFWTKTITSDTRMLYFLFFLDACYLIVYMLMANGIKGNCLIFLSKTLSYLGVILAVECALRVWELKDATENIFALWYYMGWGLSNEAGIMICFAIPFVFYLMAKSESVKGILFENVKILVCIIGLLLTCSRGSYIFGFLEIGFFYVALLFCAKKDRAYQNLFLIYSSIIILFLLIFKNDVIVFVQDVYSAVFEQGMSDNGRKDLWQSAMNIFNQNKLYTFLGAGYNVEIKELITAAGRQLGPQVYHSTLFQTLTMGGILGIIFLVIHFIEKYYNIFRCEKLFFVITGVGYLALDAYGMIDNTYHMYYYMIPLVVVMACVDNSIIEKKRSKDLIENTEAN